MQKALKASEALISYSMKASAFGLSFEYKIKYHFNDTISRGGESLITIIESSNNCKLNECENTRK